MIEQTKSEDGRLIQILKKRRFISKMTASFENDGTFQLKHENGTIFSETKFEVLELTCAFINTIPICSIRNYNDVKYSKQPTVTYDFKQPYTTLEHLKQFRIFLLEFSQNDDEEIVSLQGGGRCKSCGIMKAKVLNGEDQKIYAKYPVEHAVGSCHIFYRTYMPSSKVNTRDAPEELLIYAKYGEESMISTNFDEFGNILKFSGFCGLFGKIQDCLFGAINMYAFIGVQFDNELNPKNAVYIVTQVGQYFVIPMEGWLTFKFVIDGWTISGNSDLENINSGHFYKNEFDIENTISIQKYATEMMHYYQ
eukprot:NODE_186_length_13589_cov_0.385545.p7 type:complete len:308 gc:universal NODE_186_length_13589_cov_0.385545:7282-8205(+)